MKISSQQVVTDFRKILRHFAKLPSFQNKDSSLRQYVRQQYTIGKTVTDTDRVESLRAIANSYATMATDIRELKYLRYLDSGEKLDQRDKIRATAALVGLSVPFFSDEKPLEENNNDEQNNDKSDENATEKQ